MSFKIGISMDSLDALSNWQERILDAILNTEGTELFIISISGKSEKVTQGKSVSGNMFSGKSIAMGVLSLQRKIESVLFFKEPKSATKLQSSGVLSKSDTLTISSLSNSGVLMFTENEREIIKEQGIDLLINFTTLDISREDSPLFTHGIWDFLFCDVNQSKRGPIGFYEVIEKQEGIGFALLCTSLKSEGKQVIDAGFFNRGWSVVKTEITVKEAAVSVISKNIKLLKRDKIINNPSVSAPVYEHKRPTLFSVLKYCYSFYFMIGVKISDRVLDKIGIRSEKWSIFLGQGIFMDTLGRDEEPFEMPNDEFWADPFLFDHKGQRYVFFENYSYLTKRGKISCGLLKEDKLVNVTDVLAVDYHLSFPFIFEEEGDVFLMPESSENKRLEIYRAVDFPTKWELYTTAFEGEAVADAFFYNDNENQKWLFLNKQVSSASPMDSELYIYKVDSIRLKNLQSHAQNPVIIDSRTARNGGALFTHNGKLYRPSQRNIDGIYGRALNLNEILTLNINEYKESTAEVVKPTFDKGLMAMHHLHQSGAYYIFDAAYRRK